MTVCVALSLFVQVTFVPTLTVRLLGAKAKFARAILFPPLLGAVVGAVVGVVKAITVAAVLAVGVAVAVGVVAPPAVGAQIGRAHV